jgi:hypothetical protein
MGKPTVRPGELHIYYGVLDRHSAPDVIYHSGDGCCRSDRALLHHVIGSQRQRFIYGEEARKEGTNFKFDPSLLDELEARGYDLATLRFSIKKKEPRHD